MSTATDHMPVPTLENPVADTIGKLEGHMNKIRNMSAEVAGRLLGPSPTSVEEASTQPSHIHGRLQELNRYAEQIGDDLEALLQQL